VPAATYSLVYVCVCARVHMYIYIYIYVCVLFLNGLSDYMCTYGWRRLYERGKCNITEKERERETKGLIESPREKNDRIARSYRVLTETIEPFPPSPSKTEHNKNHVLFVSRSPTFDYFLEDIYIIDYRLAGIQSY